jgi:cellobiose phosphorylase
MQTGPHGLPLMGSGDWNDGMNKVGHQGKGESVWLSWFLMATLKNFLPICEGSNDFHHLNLFKSHISKLQTSTEATAWDGDWYIRAFFDNGEKIGSKENQECKIDSIAQSWAILSNSGEKKRSRKAIESAYDRLFDTKNRIIKLFDPPFDKSSQNPGYIKNYLPGVRENGGQYTHAGIWLMMAFAEVGDDEKTWKLLEALNPINHSLDQKSANLYKLEPFVVAADIYSEDPNKGRGGWSWYTGSSGWLYRAILESFVGLKLKGDELHFKPCMPKEWDMVKIDFRFEDKIIHIKLINSPEDQPFLINGIESPLPKIKLRKDLS